MPMDSQAMESEIEYVYQPLSTPRSIRIATLLPGEAMDPLTVALQEYELDDKSLQYQALSYCWGDGNRDFPINCQDGMMRVMDNLAAALLRLRHVSTPLLLWIDAICIDQRNLDERSEQVIIMGEIFKKAGRVFIWLGEEDFTTSIAYVGLKALMDGTWNLSKEQNDQIAKLPGLEEVCKYLKIPNPNSPELYAIERLFQRPWFFRAWVYQEYILARETLIMTGPHVIHGSWIPAMFVNILDIENIRRRVKPKEMEYWLGTAVARAFATFYPWSKIQERLPKATFWDKLQSLLTLRRGVSAKDPRDLVYCLLGAASDNLFQNLDPGHATLLGVPDDSGVRHLTPDYSRPWEEVFVETAKKIIIGKKNLDSFGQVDSDRTASLPSWVSDWRKPNPKSPRFHSGTVDTIAPIGDRKKRKFFATGVSEVRLGLNDDPRKLVLEGLGVDEITSIASNGNELAEMIDFIADSPAGKYGPTQENIRLAYLRMLCQDSSVWDWNDEEQITRKEDIYPPSALQYTDFLLENTKWPSIVRAIDLYKRNSFNFITSKGYFGWAPKHAKVGDRVYLLFGAEVPTLLRKEDDEFIVIGECYVHGLMNGEGLVNARAAADSSYNTSHRSWLGTLHEEQIPFETELIVLR